MGDSGIPVPFEGDGAGEGPLTWGQQQCWRAMVATGSSLPMGAVITPHPGLTVADYVRALSFWMSRYAALRTRMRLTDPPVQVVAGSGSGSLRVIESADPDRTARELLARWKAAVFDYEHEWPVRLAVVTSGGVVARAVMVICHLAGDAASVEVMNRELLDPDPGPYTAPQPVELARRQRATGARHSVVSLRHWEAQLRTIPARRFGPPREHAGYRRLSWDSPALHPATRDGAVLLAAFAIGMRDVLGSSPLVAQVIVGNRFRPGLADVVSPLTQNGLCVLDVTGTDLAGATGRAVRALMAASKHAYYSPDDWLALIGRVDADRGEHIELGVLWNDRRMGTDAPTAAERQPVREEPMAYFNEQLMVNVDDVPGTVRITAEFDTAHVSASELRAVLDRMEAVVLRR